MEGVEKNTNTQATTKVEQQAEQSIPNVLVASASPQHGLDADTDTVKIKDVFNTVIQNINHLTKEDMKNILVDSTTKAQLCSHPILVGVDEIEKEDMASVGDKTQKQEISIAPP